MNKLLIGLIFFLQSVNSFCQNRISESLRVTEIKRNKNWFEIYAFGVNGKFKLISDSINVIYNLDTIEIKENNKYSFVLTEITNDFYFLGIKQTLNTSYCFNIDIDLCICAEPKNGIFKIYYINKVKELKNDE